MKKPILILGAIVAIAVAAPFAVRYWPKQPPPSAVPALPPQKAGQVPDGTHFAKLEAKALSACRCARGKDEAGITACFAEFDKDTAPFAPSAVYSMCGASNESLCFGMPGGFVTPEAAKKIKCISVNRSGSGICTDADARAAAAAAKASGMDC